MRISNASFELFRIVMSIGCIFSYKTELLSIIDISVIIIKWILKEMSLQRRGTRITMVVTVHEKVPLCF